MGFLSNWFGHKVRPAEVNANFATFSKLSKDEQNAIKQSVFDDFMKKSAAAETNAFGQCETNAAYRDLVYGAISSSKRQRLLSYRRMADFPEVDNAIDEICDSALNYDENNHLVTLKIREGKTNSVKESEIQSAFDEYIDLFDLEHNFFDYMKTLVMEGQLCFENIIDKNHIDEGIIGVNLIANDLYEFLIDPISHDKKGIYIPKEQNKLDNYSNLFAGSNMLIDNGTGSVGSGPNPKNFNKDGVVDDEHRVSFSDAEGMAMLWDQVTYIDSGKYSTNKLIVLPVLEKAKKAYRQLALIEDAIIIYRLVRAPQRLIFNVDVGKLPKAKAEMEVYKMMKKYSTKQFYNPVTGSVSSDYDAQQLLECLALDTKIPLLDGRILSLETIINEYNNGKKNWVLGCSPVNGKVVPLPISWAGVTRKNADVLKITFDNGKSIVCTPDHKFPVWEKGPTEAKDLKENDSVIAYNTKTDRIGNGSKNAIYDQVFDHESQSWKFIHQLISNETDITTNVYDEKYIKEDNTFNVIHHIDFNKHNNNPENLCRMNRKDHWKLHSDNMSHRWQDPAFREHNLKLMSDYWTDDKKHFHGRQKSFKFSKRLLNVLIAIMRQQNIFTLNEIISYINGNKQNAFMFAFKVLHIENTNFDEITKNINSLYISKLIKFCGFHNYREFRRFVFPGVGIKTMQRNYSHDMLLTLIDTIKSTKYENISDLVEYFNKTPNCAFVIALKEANADRQKLKSLSGWHIHKLVRHFGYESYTQFKESLEHHNHRVVSVEKLSQRIDTGTITVDQDEEFYDFHTFATDAGVFTFNSYWFAKPSGTEGTKIDTIKGDTSWSEIPELDYFYKKLWLSLKIPFSRFMDPKVVVNHADAMPYEEYRFAKFIIRLNDRFAVGLLKGFVTHLKLKGLWEEYELKERDLKIQITQPPSFSKYEQQQLLKLKFENYDIVTKDHPEMSKEIAMERYLGYSTDDIQRNRAKVIEENNYMSSLKYAASNIEKNGNPYTA